MRVSIVNGICARHDAISDAVLGTQRAIREQFGASPVIFCYACDYPDIDHRIVRGVSDLLLSDEFMSSDLIIYHYGIYYELFNSIYLRNDAKKIVRYHNVTPAALLPASQRSIIKRSEQQKANCAAADAVWTDSDFNRQDLIDYGVPPGKMTTEPLFLKFRNLSDEPPERRERGVELLFVGRFVESKGIVDLLEAVAYVKANYPGPFHLNLVGNQTFSDQSFVGHVKTRARDLDILDVVEFEGQVSDDRLRRLYAQADLFTLPSYHEGFCVPLIEALQNRCVPLTYDAGNLPSLVDRWGVVVETGDRAALGQALLKLVKQFKFGRPKTLQLDSGKIAWKAYEDAVDAYLKTFTFEAFSSRVRAGVNRVLA